MNELGFWGSDKAGLPCFEYTGNIPYREKLENGTDVKLPEDPWFLLGNYRLTLFTHVSSEYELISGQRSWARINQGKNRNSGVNSSAITLDGKVYPLTRMDSLAAKTENCKKVFGCGFANYSYEIGAVFVNRNLSVKPSTEIDNGASAFLLTVKVKNSGEKPADCTYKEFIGANFEMIQYQTAPAEWLPLRYKNEYSEDKEKRSACVKITAESDDPLLAPDREAMSKYDAFPPQLFMKLLSENGMVYGDDKGISAEFSFTLEPNEEKIIRLIIGYSFEYGLSMQDKICKELDGGKTVTEPGCAFAEDWLKVLPDFPNEQDKNLRRELRWHAYNLEAMATYSEYYGETKIPQGTIYDYDWGCHASARDNFQHALPLVYYNPKLAKSVLKYMLKRTTPFGEIRLIEMGNGYADNERYFTSDQQLYFFLLLSEYLRVTKDYNFMNEKVQPYPAKNQREMTVAELAEKCFIFLRDTVGTGSHGLVKLLNSDWNDAVYYIEKVPYNNIFLTGESHMNSAMVISILGGLIPQLKTAALYCGQLSRLVKSMIIYRSKILSAFLMDMGERSFPRRMYFNGKPYGDDNMFLEPQGFTLQINELSEDRKRRLYKTVNLSFDEWNIWFHSNEQDKQIPKWTVAPPLLEDVYNLEDAVVLGNLLITLLKNCDRVKIACLAQLVNVIAPIMTETGGKVWAQTIYYPFMYTSSYGRGTALETLCECGCYNTEKMKDIPFLDAVAVASDDGKQLSVFVINRSMEESCLPEIEIKGFENFSPCTHISMEGDDLKATNTMDNPENVTAKIREISEIPSVAPHSWNLILLRQNEK